MANGVTWQVTGQSQDTVFGADNTPQSGKKVTFQTSTGYTGTIFIPDALYVNTDYVRGAIQAEVDATEAVRTLTSG